MDSAESTHKKLDVSDDVLNVMSSESDESSLKFNTRVSSPVNELDHLFAGH